jgi:hypothetical protein
VEADDGLLGRLLGRAYGTEAKDVWTGLNLLNQLKSLKIEDKNLVLKNDYEHILP